MFVLIRAWLIVRRGLANVVRIRSAKHDRAVVASCDRALVWVERTAPAMLTITPLVHQSVIEDLRETG